MSYKIRTWLIAAGIRAVKTAAQTALGMFTVGSAVSEINVKNILSVSLVAGVYSLITSIATKLPELEEPIGKMVIDDTNGKVILKADVPKNSKNAKLEVEYRKIE